MNGAFFTKVFHRSMPRGITAANQAGKKSKDIKSKTMTTSTKAVSTQAAVPKEGSRFKIWDQASVDPEMITWYYFP